MGEADVTIANTGEWVSNALPTGVSTPGRESDFDAVADATMEKRASSEWHSSERGPEARKPSRRVSFRMRPAAPVPTLALIRRDCRDPGGRVSQLDERVITIFSACPDPQRPMSRPPAVARREGLSQSSMFPSVVSFQPSCQGRRTESPPRVAAWRPRSPGTSSSPT
jgi:hypothetical protein